MSAAAWKVPELQPILTTCHEEFWPQSGAKTWDLTWDLPGPDDGRFFSGRDLEILGTEGMGKPCSEWRPIGCVFRELSHSSGEWFHYLIIFDPFPKWFLGSPQSLDLCCSWENPMKKWMIWGGQPHDLGDQNPWLIRTWGKSTGPNRFETPILWYKTMGKPMG